MSPPRLTVGLPVFNGERHLAQAIESILGQSFGDFELVVSDNASTDATVEITRRYAAADRRVRVTCHPENAGLAVNHNRLVTAAESELFKWASADDYLAPGHLARCVAELDAHPGAVLAYARAQFVDDAGRPLDRHDPGWDLREAGPAARLRRVLHGGHWLNALLGVARREALLRTRLLPDFPDGDFVLLGELTLLGTIHEAPEPLYFRRLHATAPNQQTDQLAQRLLYLAARTDHLPVPTLARYRAHARTIRESDLPVASKLQLLAEVGRVLWWRRDRIAFERRVVRATRRAVEAR